MKLQFSKFQGAGNDFILIDNRNQNWKLSTEIIEWLCDRHFGIGADGLMFLENSEYADFQMTYFNSDGKESSMCGNGGRCIAAFANSLGIGKEKLVFRAIDGFHEAEILQNQNVRLKMKDVESVTGVENNFFLHTGSPHFVTFVENAQIIDVVAEGRKIRYSEPFSPSGTNVNFAHYLEEKQLFVRTYERGVEDETMACGTGAVAAAIAAYLFQHNSERNNIFHIHTLGGELKVSFSKEKCGFKNVYLEGSAVFVFSGEINVPEK